MKNLFKPEDVQINFNKYCKNSEEANELMTDILKSFDKKLNALIQSWPVVMATKVFTESKPEELSWHPENIPDKDSHYIQFCTHKARLAFVERIDKEGQCVHEPDDLDANVQVNCKHCGVILEPIWTEKK